MEIVAYGNIEAENLARAEQVKGKNLEYWLQQPKELVVNMPYRGEGKFGTNADGWVRDAEYYFKKLFKEHPEYFSEENRMVLEKRIEYKSKGLRIPDIYKYRCDKAFIEHFPQYKPFEGEKLIHHHVGEDGQVVAVPLSVHSQGHGNIHNDEKLIGVTKNADEYTQWIKEQAQKYKSPEEFCKEYRKNPEKFQQQYIKERGLKFVPSRQKDIESSKGFLRYLTKNEISAAKGPLTETGVKTTAAVPEAGGKVIGIEAGNRPNVAGAIAAAGRKAVPKVSGNAAEAVAEGGIKTVAAKDGTLVSSIMEAGKNEHGGISLNTLGKVGKGAMHGLVIAGAAMDLHDVVTSDKPLETGLEKAGGWGGALAGAELFGGLGTAIEPGPGTLILGGIGSVIGYYHGEKAVKENMDIVKEVVTGEGGVQAPVVAYPDGSQWTTYWVPEMGIKMFTPVRAEYINHSHYTENGVAYKIVHAKELYPDVDNLQVAPIYINAAGEKCGTYWDPGIGLVRAPLQAHPNLGYHTENGVTYDIVHASDLYPDADKREDAKIGINEAGEKVTVYWHPDKGLVEAPVQKHPYHGYHTVNGITYEVAYVEGITLPEEVVATASRDEGEEIAQAVQQASSPEKTALPSGPVLALNSGPSFAEATKMNVTQPGEAAQAQEGISTHPGIDDLLRQAEEIKKLQAEREKYQGEPLTREKAEQRVKSDYLKGEDEQLAQQAEALKEERAQLQQEETRHNNYGRQTGFDRAYIRYIPSFMKSDELKVHHGNHRQLAQWKQDVERKEAELAKKTEELEARLQIPEARAAVAEKTAQYLADDAARQIKLKNVEAKLGERKTEMNGLVQKVLGGETLQQSLEMWRRIEDILNVQQRPKLPAWDSLKLGEAREYRLQAKEIIKREGCWPGPSGDAEIVRMMAAKGYSTLNIKLALIQASPETAGTPHQEALQYAGQAIPAGPEPVQRTAGLRR